MRFRNSIAAISLLPSLSVVSAHGRVTNVTTSSGVVYAGWDPALAPESSSPLAAWSASNLGNVFVPPSDFNTSDITCHFNATPGALHINTTAGDTLRLQWNEWPVSHKGPVLTYLAACDDSCGNADKNTLRWVKIDQLGWLNSSGIAILGGTWASDVLIAQDFSWTVKIPEGLADGAYVLRHEIIALHVADEMDGAQAYPQCVNLRVTGGGSKRVSGGKVGRTLYGEKDKGIFVDIHRNVTEYDIPGPPLWTGATRYSQVAEKS